MGGCRRRLNKNAERFPVARITQKRKKEQCRLGIGEHARERRGELFTPSVKPPLGSGSPGRSAANRATRFSLSEPVWAYSVFRPR